jgi:hypothetical protein
MITMYSMRSCVYVLIFQRKFCIIRMSLRNGSPLNYLFWGLRNFILHLHHTLDKEITSVGNINIPVDFLHFSQISTE